MSKRDSQFKFKEADTALNLFRDAAASTGDTASLESVSDIRLSINELRYFERRWQLEDRPRTNVPAVEPERELISHIGKHIPQYKTWRRNLNFILSYMTMSRELIPVIKSIHELDPNLLRKFNVAGGLDDNTIDFLVNKNLLEEQYAGTAKLLERVSKFIAELGHPGHISPDGRTFQDRVRSAYDCQLISQNCYRELITHGKSAIHQLEESVFTAK
jgi:hypothetical protein